MRALSLFSGIGGLDLAAEWAGIETAAFCEYADFPRRVLRKHWPDVPIYKDIRKLNRSVLEKEGVIDRDKTIGLVHGGFPCQPYSIAGEQLGKEDDRDLWPEMFRVTTELHPRWVVGENVANFVNMELERTLTDLESEGYETQTFIIPAAAVDAKHQRSRTFVVAHSDSLWEQQSKRSIGDIWGWFGDRSEIMAYSESNSSGGLSSGAPAEESRFKFGGEDVAHTDSERRGQVEQYDRGGAEKEKAIRSSWERRIQCGGGTSWWELEPELGRVAHGVPNRVDRLKSLGNAVVPQQAFPIFAAIMEIERLINLQ
ncbi:DNA cytosine methyltransferase [Enterococcus avium]|uniref:DNA cytosine methyltransferase n=1 Tax=Enterococcus TaxID=1350 RepID=UPI0008A358AF|nr:MULTISPECIES: DNA cytosine methyltransferase [Enterococcus]MBX9121901.1 DNA (cytosine-5-)-methyltransferase [Enterococcus sp. K18_3]MDO7797586.1 DNA cytosine methyltransferase [Enterococcus avium]OFN63199.1 hypothetical protein HMPREF2539_16390 [Enterococcus sp. HMSC064A12]